MDTSSAAVLVLVGLVALRWVMIGIGAALLVRPVRSCPACFAPTFVLHRRWLRRLAPWLEWRWCAGCGWQGPARRIAGRSPVAPREHGGHPAYRPQRPNS